AYASFQGATRPLFLSLSCGRRGYARASAVVGADQPVDEAVAKRELLERHEFIGLVRLDDAAGTAHHGWHTAALEEGGFRAVGDHAHAFARSEIPHTAKDRIRLLRVERRDGIHALERDMASRIDGSHAREKLALREAGDLRDERLGVEAWHVAELEAEFGRVRHDVSGRSAREKIDRDRGVRHVEALGAQALPLFALGDRLNEGDDARAIVNRVDGARRERGMGRLAGDLAAIDEAALMRS